jgi:hypothetical protein
MRNKFPMFAQIPKMYQKDDINYLILEIDSLNGGYKVLKMNDMQDKAPIADDWFLEYDDVMIAANEYYGVNPTDWKKMK